VRKRGRSNRLEKRFTDSKSLKREDSFLEESEACGDVDEKTYPSGNVERKRPSGL
jgi:hypothetical protein